MALVRRERRGYYVVCFSITRPPEAVKAGDNLLLILPHHFFFGSIKRPELIFGAASLPY